MTFDPRIALHFGQRFVIPILDVHRAFLSNLTPGLPLHGLWPHECTTLRSGILPTKFGGHRVFLKQLGFGWPLTFGGVTSKICPQTLWACPLPHAKFQLDASKHDEAHSCTYILTHTHTHCTDLAILVYRWLCLKKCVINGTKTLPGVDPGSFKAGRKGKHLLRPAVVPGQSPTHSQVPYL